jgi:hypothetical protein
MVANKYSHWFTGIEKGIFPLVDEKNNNWQPLLDTNISRKVVGVENVSDADSYMPSLIFEQVSNFPISLAQILNTDYLNNCRVLQYKIAGLSSFLALQANRANIFSGRVTLDTADKEKYLQRINQDLILSFGNLKLVFTNGAVILSRNGLNLTKNSHLNTSLYVEGKRYNSNSGHWEFKKESQNKIVAYGSWGGLALKQIWEFEINSDSEFLWKVWLEINKEVNIQEQRLQFMCIGEYSYFFCDYAEGDFPKMFSETEFDILQRCIPDGIIGISHSGKQLPDLSLEFSQASGSFAKILNADFYNKARLLRVERVESEEETKFAPGKYLSFAIKAKLNASEEPMRKRLSNRIDKGKLKFIFYQGSGAIFWDEKELTKKLGFYTSVRSQGRWHNSSSSALWKIEDYSNHTIAAKGRWLHLPITQLWEIKLREEGLIEFKVFLEVKNRIIVERLQANLMLSEQYTCWLSEKQKGVFPLFVADMTDDWQQVYCAEEKTKFIGVSTGPEKQETLPKVCFFPISQNSEWLLHIVNSDCYHRGRVLQYLNPQSVIIESGEYTYAHGTISIEKKTYD